MYDFSKYLCIFGGGAVRGYAYSGVLKAFAERGFCPDKIAGSSVGAIFATFMALEIPLDEIENIAAGMNYELFRDINFSLGADFSISKGCIFTERFRDITEKAFYKNNYKKSENPPVTFKDLKKDLIIISTDITNFKPFIFSKSATPDCEVALAIRASASMPGLMSPLEYDGKLLADGDIMKGNPVWRLDKSLCPQNYRILELRLEGSQNNKKIKNFMDYFNCVYSCMTTCSTDFIIDIYANRDKFDYIKIDTKDLFLVNFNISNDLKNKLSDIGYNSAINFFDKVLPQKEQFFFSRYKMFLKYLNKISELISKNKVCDAKILLGEIFVLLSDLKLIIDLELNKKIKNFREIFYENIQKGFFGKEKFKNVKMLINIINQIKLFILEKDEKLNRL